MRSLSPYRSLLAEKRVALVAHDIASSPASRERYVRLIVARGGGFRLETVRKRSTDQLAREIVRFALETSADEVGLLQTLYVEREPELQIAFLDSAGVKRDGAVISDDLEPPFADAPTVRRAALALIEAHGDDARAYLRTISIYNSDAWPGLSEVLAEIAKP